jgi:Amt family ammonium transporter
MIKLIKKFSISLVILFSITSFASAESTISAEGQYIFNTLGFYLGGVLVAFMAAGFCMLECGLVTTKSVHRFI